MSLYEVPDYRLDPPEAHVESCECDDCHEYHLDTGLQGFARECQRCEAELDIEQSLGIRCEHGEAIPFFSDLREKGRFKHTVITDVECAKGCQIDYGPAVAKEWIARLEREAA